jgi:hypothetical protein
LRRRGRRTTSTTSSLGIAPRRPGEGFSANTEAVDTGRFVLLSSFSSSPYRWKKVCAREYIDKEIKISTKIFFSRGPSELEKGG